MKDKSLTTSVTPILLSLGIITVVACLFFGFSSMGEFFIKIRLAISFLLLLFAFLMWGRLRSGKLAFPNSIALAIGTVALILVLLLYTPVNNGNLFMVTALLALLLSVAVYLKCTNQLDEQKLMLLILLASFVVKLAYILATDLVPVAVRQHDVHSFGGADGHAAYIEYFYKNWSLPNFDPRSIWQFYHPPTHHFLAAVWLYIQTAIGIPYLVAVEGIQFLTLFYSCASVVLGKRIFEVLGLKGRSLLCAVTITAFSPAFILFSGSVNNDILSVLLLLAAVLSALKWNNSDRLCHLLQTAVFIGLGMSVKTSVAVVAFPVAALMLYKLYKQKQKLKTVIHYAIFGAVVFPLGLWWPVRNMLKFVVPFNYVPLLSDDNYQYVGFRNLLERFCPFVGMGKEPYFSWSGEYEYNAWSGLFKSSAFGEYSMRNYSIWSARFEDALFFFTMAICILSFVAMLYFLIARKTLLKPDKWFVIILYLVTLGSYLVFCYQFPHTCTMNIRYASPLVIVGAFFTGALLKTSGEKQNNDTILRANSFCRIVTTASVVGFCIFSTLVYTLLLV